MRLAGVEIPLRAAGLVVVEHVGWRDRGYRGRDLSPARGAMWHHTGTPTSRSGDYPTAGYIIDGAPTSPLAQIGLARSGAVHLLAAGLCNHAGKGAWPGLVGNNDTIGIEMESPGDGSWTPAQRGVMPILGRVLKATYAIPTQRQISHAEWATPRGRKTDPVGINMPALRRLIDIPLAPTVQEDDMPTTQEIAEAVWSHMLPEINGVGPASGSAFLRHAAIHATWASAAASRAAGVEVDEQEIAKSVVALLPPAALVGAIPDDLAQQVVDLLGDRLAGGAS